MRREGRAHGMVQTFSIIPEPFNMRPWSRVLNKVDIAPTNGFFVKVPSKPTNHSKFTGKCDRHSKSKHKSKGSYKLSYKVFGWAADDNTPVVGYSASRILNDLHAHAVDDHYDDDESSIAKEVSVIVKDDDDDETSIVKEVVCRDNVIVKDDDDDDDVIVHGGVTADGDDGYQGFYDVSGMFYRVVDDDHHEGWSLVN